MNSLARAIQLLADYDRDQTVRSFADLAGHIARSREPYWRWTSYLAAAIALRKNGIA